MRTIVSCAAGTLMAACLCLPAGVSRAGAAALKPATGLIGVSAAGPARTVTPTLLGLNGVNTTGPRWNDGPFDSVLGRFGPGVIRYPGGAAANYWSWTAGWYQPGNWPGKPGKPVDDSLPVFAAALRASGAVPLFDLNTVTYNGAIATATENTAMLDQQLKFLQAASEQGLPVQMVELGNELYLNGNRPGGAHSQDYARRFPTAADYATQMNSWIAAIHRDFPQAQVAAVGADAEGVPGLSERRRTWNADVLSLLDGQNAMTMHENLRVDDPKAAPATVLAEPYLHFQQLKTHELALFSAHHLPVWITEFNMADMTAGHVFEGTWLHGLFVAEEALLFASDPDITYLGLNATIGDAESAPIFSGSHAFGRSPQTVPLALSAAGTTLEMIQAAFRGASAAQPLAFSPNPSLAAGGAPALLGEELTTQSGPKLLIVNLSSQPCNLDLSASLPGSYTATQITAPSISTRVTGPASVEASTVTTTGGFEIKPYTLADISG